MVGIDHRTSLLSQGSGIRDLESSSRPRSKDGTKKNIWSSMLDGVASGKRLPEKNILVLGGTPESQKEFLETLSTDPFIPGLSTDRRKNNAPPIANQFALGYTYQDVLDADHEDILARLSVHLLSEPSPSFSPLLRPLLTPQSVPNTLIVILLDWADPWSWVRKLSQWIRLLRAVLISLDDDVKIIMEEVMTEWRDCKRGGDASAVTGTKGGAKIPIGPGEWDEGLGIPLCVADKIEKLEREHGWQEQDFDFVLQFLRTILLKHGASLIYTTSFLANPLQSLIHSSLGIHSLLKRESLKHNIIDRDKILVPPNWDSWGKIRTLGVDFDIEGIGNAWSMEIQHGNRQVRNGHGNESGSVVESEGKEGSPINAVSIYEQIILDPKGNKAMGRSSEVNGSRIEVETVDTQQFLAKQSEVLEQLKTEDEKRDRQARKGAPLEGSANGSLDESGQVSEHIGPVQFNMGGIQVDADDMLKKLKEREANRTPRKELPAATTAESKAQNEALANFFAGLMKKGSNNTPRAPPPT